MNIKNVKLTPKYGTQFYYRSPGSKPVIMYISEDEFKIMLLKYVKPTNEILAPKFKEKLNNMLNQIAETEEYFMMMLHSPEEWVYE